MDSEGKVKMEEGRRVGDDRRIARVVKFHQNINKASDSRGRCLVALVQRCPWVHSSKGSYYYYFFGMPL